MKVELLNMCSDEYHSQANTESKVMGFPDKYLRHYNDRLSGNNIFKIISSPATLPP